MKLLSLIVTTALLFGITALAAPTVIYNNNVVHAPYINTGEGWKLLKRNLGGNLEGFSKDAK